MGTLTFDEAYDIILEQVETVKDQVDLVLFETMSDLYEVKAGVLAVKEHTDLPVFVTMTSSKMEERYLEMIRKHLLMLQRD